jgi:hypothetical protein
MNEKYLQVFCGGVVDSKLGITNCNEDRFNTGEAQYQVQIE